MIRAYGLIFLRLLPEKEEIPEGHLKPVAMEIPNGMVCFCDCRLLCEVFCSQSVY